LVSEQQPERVRTVGGWFGPAERPLVGWLTTPNAGEGATGVLILPPVGYAYWSSHRTLRVIAERLAGLGHAVLRIDYDGTGDSAGAQWDGGRLGAWRASAAAAAAELRDQGCTRLILFGVRLGAAIALHDGAALRADGVVAWAPVVSGRRYVREIRLLATPVPDGVSDLPAGTLLAAGCVYLPETLDQIAGLTGAELAPPAPRLLVVASDQDGEVPGLVERLEQLGCAVERRAVEGVDRALELPAEYATPPEEVVSGIVDWIGVDSSRRPRRRARTPDPPRMRRSARLLERGVELSEEVVVLGEQRLIGIQTEPVELGDGGATLVLLNTGSEPHIGPGRAWVEIARQIAADGHRCVRMDFRGWGESPDGGFAPGRPYDEHCVEDAAAIVRALYERGDRPIMLLGLCASAWVALRMLLREPVDGVVALNPQLYWQPGDPVEATMAETRQRRTAERGREALGGRCGLWSALDALGHRPWAGRWLDELSASGVPITLAFAPGDDGIEFLRNRLQRRLARAEGGGAISIVEIPGIDHSMGRVWLRELVVEVIRGQLSALSANGVAPPATPGARGR
jgi:pimeloyl-ACP methyl ester carboxylesterase